MLRPKNELPFFETPVAAAGANWMLLSPFASLLPSSEQKCQYEKKNKNKKNPPQFEPQS